MCKVKYIRGYFEGNLSQLALLGHGCTGSAVDHRAGIYGGVEIGAGTVAAAEIATAIKNKVYIDTTKILGNDSRQEFIFLDIEDLQRTNGRKIRHIVWYFAAQQVSCNVKLL